MKFIKAPKQYCTKGFIHTLIKESEFALVYAKADKIRITNILAMKSSKKSAEKI